MPDWNKYYANQSNMHADFETLYLGNYPSSSVNELSGETIQALVDTLERRYIYSRFCRCKVVLLLLTGSPESSRVPGDVIGEYNRAHAGLSRAALPHQQHLTRPKKVRRLVNESPEYAQLSPCRIVTRGAEQLEDRLTFFFIVARLEMTV